MVWCHHYLAEVVLDPPAADSPSACSRDPISQVLLLTPSLPCSFLLVNVPPLQSAPAVSNASLGEQAAGVQVLLCSSLHLQGQPDQSQGQGSTIAPSSTDNHCQRVMTVPQRMLPSHMVC